MMDVSMRNTLPCHFMPFPILQLLYVCSMDWNPRVQPIFGVALSESNHLLVCLSKGHLAASGPRQSTVCVRFMKPFCSCVDREYAMMDVSMRGSTQNTAMSLSFYSSIISCVFDGLQLQSPTHFLDCNPRIQPIFWTAISESNHLLACLSNGHLAASGPRQSTVCVRFMKPFCSCVAHEYALMYGCEE